MALAQTIPDGIGSRYTRVAGQALRRPREAFGHYTTLQRVLGWLGLAGLTGLWAQTLAVGLRIHSLVSGYEAAHGDAAGQWEGRLPRAPELDQLKRSLEAIHASAGSYVFLTLFPVSLIVLYGFWIGCSRWALGHRPMAWRGTFLAATAVILSQAILLTPAIGAYNSITN